MAISIPNVISRWTVVFALVSNSSAFAQNPMILGAGIESRSTGEKVHLVATDFDSGGKPLYVQFQYTDAYGETNRIGPSLLVYGELSHFIRSFAIYNQMTKDPHQRRKFQVTRAIYSRNNVRVGGMDWELAVNFIGGAAGIKVANEIIQPKTTGAALAAYIGGMLAAPLMLDIVMLRYTVLADAFDSSLKFPFADDLEPLDATNRENWLLRTEKISGKQFRNFLEHLAQLPTEPAFERKPMPERTSTEPRQCNIQWDKASFDIHLPVQYPRYQVETGNTDMERARSRSNEISSHARYRLSPSEYLNPRKSSESIPWKISAGIFGQSNAGKSNVCVRVVYDSPYASAPYVQEECRELGRKRTKNYEITQGLINGLPDRLKRPTCVDGILEFSGTSR